MKIACESNCVRMVNFELQFEVIENRLEVKIVHVDIIIILSKNFSLNRKEVVKGSDICKVKVF